MESEVRFDPARSRLHVTVRGRLAIQDILAQGPDFLREHSLGDRLEMLLDYRGAEVGDISIDDVQSIVDQDEQIWVGLESLRCAIVADGDATFGMARMFATLSDRPGVEVAVFREMEEAEHWLDGAP